MSDFLTPIVVMTIPWNTITLVDVESKCWKQLRLAMHGDIIYSYKKNGSDLLWEDEGAQRAHRPNTGRAIQITPYRKNHVRGLGERLDVCYLTQIPLLQER